MAATNFTPISLYYSTTAAATPSSGNLVAGELALNTVDEKLYFKNSAGTVKLLASNAGSAGSVTSVAATVPAFLSIAGSPITTSGTLAITLSGTALPVLNGGTGTTTSTGTGNVVLSTSPTLVTPVLGTPTSATLTNATGLPISTGVSGLGTGVATFLATPTSANLASAVSDETGSGSLVFATSPTLVTPILGTPTSGTLTNATGLPLTTGVTGTLPIANGGTGQTTAGAAFNALSPITTTGDLILGNGTNSATRLPIGTNGYVLTVSGGTAVWSASGSGTVNSGTQYQLGYYATTGTAISGNSGIVTNVSNQLGIGVSPTARVGIPVPLYSASNTNGMIRFQNPDVSADSCLQSYYVTSAGSELVIGANAYNDTTGAILRFNSSYATSAINLRRDGTIGFLTNTSSGDAVTRVTVGNTGNVTFGANIGLGGTTPTTSGTGITFPATQSASTDVNTLDDYEEGTFTPTILFGGNNVGMVYNRQYGKYTKIGNRVFINIYVSISPTKGSSTGTATVAGLPFQNVNDPAGGNGAETPCAFNPPQILYSGIVTAYVENNATYIQLGSVTEGGFNSGMSEANFQGNSAVLLMCHYQTS
jgi:hypothetical protein